MSARKQRSVKEEGGFQEGWSQEGYGPRVLHCWSAQIQIPETTTHPDDDRLADLLPHEMDGMHVVVRVGVPRVDEALFGVAEEREARVSVRVLRFVVRGPWFSPPLPSPPHDGRSGRTSTQIASSFAR